MAAWCLSLTPRSRKCKMATYNLVDASDQLCIKTPSAESAKLQIVGTVQVNCRLLVTLFCSCLFAGKALNGLHVKFARKGMRCWYCIHSIVCKCIHIAYFLALQLSLLILIISCPCKRPAVCNLHYIDANNVKFIFLPLSWHTQPCVKWSVLRSW